jgi:hypothetical protein
MKGLTNATRTLIRSIVIAAYVATLALVAAQRVGATQTDDRVDPSEAATFQIAMCEAAGGKATVEVSRWVGWAPTTYVTCKGGLLDGMYCINTVAATVCTYPVVRPEEPPAVAPTGGVETEPGPTVPPTWVVGDIVAPIGVIEEPAAEEPATELSILTANVSSHVVAPAGVAEIVEDGSRPMLGSTDASVVPTEGAEEAAEDQVAESQTSDPTVAAKAAISLCEVGGGTAVVDVVRKVDGVDLVRVRCVGGTLDGWDCFFDKSGVTICDGLHPSPDESPAVAPTEGVETEPEPTVPTTETTDEAVAPTEGAEEPGAEESAVEGGVGDEGVAEEGADDGADDGAEDDAGQDSPTDPALDETTAPAEGDPAADPDAGARDDDGTEADVVADDGQS